MALVKELTFNDFQQRNKDRCDTSFTTCESWQPQDWALAIAGEAGELCNLLKKVRRGDLSIEEARADVLKELADVITYCDLLMTKLNANTADELAAKFNEVSRRVGYFG